MSELSKGHRIGPYRVVRLLGKGGMGAVYEARHEPLDRRVALKTLHPEFANNQEAVARFFNEAKILSRLEHPSIVQVSDFGNAPDGTAYLVMEYLRGQSLGHRLSMGDGRLPVIEALQLAWQVADVLAIAHAQEIIHRDLKPDNLMLVADPVAPSGERVKVLDFGIAKLTRDSDRGGVRTNTQALMGTPMYMSPEQCAGAGKVDAKSDVYSLGCVLYQMLGGRPPFDGDGAGQLIGKHLYQEPAPLASLAPRLPPAIIELVHRLLLKDSLLRPSMSETADAFGRLLSEFAGVGSATRSRSSVDPGQDSTRHPPMLRQSTTLGQSIGQKDDSASRWRRILAAGIVVVTIIAIVATAWHGRTPSQPIPNAGANTAALSSALHPYTPPAVHHALGDLAAPKDVQADPSSAVASGPSLVTWDIDTVPSGALIVRTRDQQVLGKTPWLLSQPIGEGTESLLIRFPRYEPQTVILDKRISAKLVRKLLASVKAKPSRPDNQIDRTSRETDHAKFKFTREE